MTTAQRDIPNFHDGCLTGLDFGLGTVVARIADWQGKPYTLAMDGVERFVVNVESRNLIGWLEIISERKPTRRMLNKLFRVLPHVCLPELIEDHLAEQIERADRVSQGDASLVVLHGNSRIFFIGFCANAVLNET